MQQRIAAMIIAAINVWHAAQGGVSVRAAGRMFQNNSESIRRSISIAQ
jgi:hypothetical protein